MYRQIEGSKAIAETVALCRPHVVPAYPITPQTHIVEAIGTMARQGELGNCEFITVESEFAAMSAAIGASMAGARTYTATASQGLLYMAEALFNASGLQAPVVMTVANRAIGAPINIWNDHSDAMSQRDCGWVQLYAEDNQAAVGLHVIAFKLAEQLNVPVMVCVDGFVLTHATEPIDVPDASFVDHFLPPRRPRQLLDPDDPVSIGAMVGPDAFTEVRYLTDHLMRSAQPTFTLFAREYSDGSGHPIHSLEKYRTEGARTVVLALGSVTGAVRDAVDAVDTTDGVGLVALTLYRPFPFDEVREALAGADHVIVLERAFAPGSGGIVAADVRAALTGTGTRISTVIAGLGGRPVPTSSISRLFADADGLPELSFLDLRTDVVDAEVQRLARYEHPVVS